MTAKGDSAFFFYSLLTIFVAVLAFNVLPSETPFDKVLKPAIEKGIRSAGLWQKWNMFSPNPTREDVTMFAKVILTNGEIKMWTPIRMSELSLVDKYLRERWRKWGMDNIRADSHATLWPSLGRYIESSFKNHFPESEIAKIEVYRQWYVVPDLNVRFITREQTQFEPRKEYLFYTHIPPSKIPRDHR